MFNNDQFKGRVVLIIGSASGMGKDAASVFAEMGATVVAGDVSPAGAESFAAIQSATGCEGFYQSVNVTDAASCQAIVDATVAKYGKIDALVNCAGVIQVADDIDAMPEAEWDRVLDINLKGHFLMAKAAVPQFKKQKFGRVVLIASIWGQEGFRYFAAYCSSKFGVVGFTQSLAKELVEYNVNVNAIAPGMINTELHQKALRDQAVSEGKTYEEVKQQEWSKCPMGYAGEPREITNGIVFLSSDEAKYITGATLDINGGIQMRS